MRRKTNTLLFMIILLGLVLTSGVLAQGNQGDAMIFMPLVERGDFLPDLEISLVPIGDTAFTLPTEITHAADGSGRLFIVELGGRIHILDNHVRLNTPFLEIPDLVIASGERGLLGLAFHPDYENNGYFFIDYTREPDGATVIARYQVSSSDPNQADPDSATVLLTIDQPETNHNGGKMAFGPDGYLYIASGDGGGSGDPNNNAQNPDTLLGKILRLDVDGGTPYAIPADNPYSSGGGRPEIWALGLRNPWRFSFDQRTGDLYIGDVGQGAWEEIDYQPMESAGGVNYGWRCFEGTHIFNTEAPCDDPDYLASLTMPVIEYPHSVSRSVTGGYVYRGTEQPGMFGRYLYADFISGIIWTTYLRADGSFADPQVAADNTGIRISTFGEDEQGELYVADYTAGMIYQLTAAVP